MNRPDLTATITGLAAADAELTRTPSGTAVARARVPHAPRRRNPATGRWEDAGEPTWVTVTAWGDQAQAFAAAVRKGTPVTATGRPRVRTWADAEEATRAELAIDARTWGVIPPTPPPVGPVPTASAPPPDGDDWAAWQPHHQPTQPAHQPPHVL